jgi:AcrR family transcriptional regulator
VETLLDTMAAAAPTRATSPHTRLRRVLSAYLNVMSREEAMARVFLVDVYAAGPAALERRREVMDQFVATIANLLEARTADERFAVEALVAAVSSMVTVRVAVGAFHELPGLLDPIMKIAQGFLP